MGTTGSLPGVVITYHADGAPDDMLHHAFREGNDAERFIIESPRLGREIRSIRVTTMQDDEEGE